MFLKALWKPDARNLDRIHSRWQHPCMVSINPQIIHGNWTSGYALDFHTLSSECIGHNDYGYLQFHNVRSELGELIYRLKYKRELCVADTIVSTAADFVSEWKPDIDLIIPVPPSALRDWQPVNILARETAKALGVDFSNECIFKTRPTPELKNVDEFEKRYEMLEGAYSIYRSGVERRKILLVDDLFRSGATLMTICEVLKRKGDVADLHTLTITRTRNRT